MAFESKDLKVNLGKTKVRVSGSITKEGMSKSKVDPSGVYCLRIKANTVLCVQCWYVDPWQMCLSEKGGWCKEINIESYVMK